MDAWTADSSVRNILQPDTGPDPNNPLFAAFVAASQELKTQAGNSDGAAVFSAIADGDLVAVEKLVTADAPLVESFFPDSAGFTPLIFAILLQEAEIARALLEINGADPDTPDTTAAQYTPLMWAVACKDSAMVSLLFENQADPLLAPKTGGKNALALVPDSSLEIQQFFLAHNVKQSLSNGDSDIFHLNTFGGDDDFEDDLAHKTRMMTLVTGPNSDPLDEENELDEEAALATDSELVLLPEFDYAKVLPDQFIKFSDSDIPSLLDYIFGLRTKSSTFQHNTKIPAAIIYQLLHYSHDKVDSKDLTEFLFECFVTRLRSVTNTMSGVFNMALTTGDLSDKKTAGGAGDIVLLSYWLAVIQMLHFYLVKGKLYGHYPTFLQELVNLVQSLIATLSFLINSRLNLLVDDCILNYTNLVDVSSVLYAKDWNLFKSQKKHPNTYDDILEMLFPPTQNELMKPSPLKYVQVLGALHYVLELHSVDPLLRVQTFSQVFYYINCIIFNRLIANSKYCSRAKAVQIRLNISALEDWLRSRNFRPHKPDTLGGIEALIRRDASNPGVHLDSLLALGEDQSDPRTLQFYYKSLYHVGKAQMMPTIELLQWLQVMSGLLNEEELINTINQFERLNYYQLVKVAGKLYRYEVEESKLPKPLLQLLKRLVAEQGEAQISKSILHYMTQSTFLLKEVYIYLNPNYVFGISLPNTSELIQNYGAGLGGTKKLRAKKYQPSLPMEVMDDVDEILLQNRNENFNDTYDYDKEEDERASEGEVAEETQQTPSGHTAPQELFKGDEMFKQMQPPLSLAHKHWGDTEIESNPW